jgi:hypothetical protein
VAAEDPGAVAARLPSGERPIRAAEVVGALSLATDLGTGQPLEHALRTAVLAVRLGELAGASAQELVDTYYVALLHSSGCGSSCKQAVGVARGATLTPSFARERVIEGLSGASSVMSVEVV